jgi:hypothetical protein
MVKFATLLPLSVIVGGTTVDEGVVLSVTNPVVGVPVDDSTVTITPTSFPYGTVAGTLTDVVVEALTVVKVHEEGAVVTFGGTATSFNPALIVAVYRLK